MAYAFSPRVEAIAPGTVALDIAGLGHLFGAPREIAAAMARRAAELGLAANVAVARNLEAAMHAARGFDGVTVIEPGDEARALAALPLRLLSAPPEVEEIFRTWGLRCFGDLAALPEPGVAERLGQQGARLWKLARGAGDRLLFPAIPAPAFKQRIELEYPVELLEPLAFILSSLLNQVCAGLEARALAADELRLRLKLQPATPSFRSGWAPADPEHTLRAAAGSAADFERVLRLPFPLRDSQTFLKLLRLDLESHPPPAPVVAVSLAARAVKPRVIQSGLFLPQAPEPAKLELTLARIAHLAGAGNVGSPELLDTHRPEGFQMRNAECGMRNAELRRPERKLRVTPHSAPRTPRLGFRVFRPPVPAAVKTLNERPTYLAARGIRGPVIEAAGPWRSTGDWWAADAWARDEWDIGIRNEDQNGLYRIYCDLRTGEWYVEGCYD